MPCTWDSSRRVCPFKSVFRPIPWSRQSPIRMSTSSSDSTLEVSGRNCSFSVVIVTGLEPSTGRAADLDAADELEQRPILRRARGQCRDAPWGFSRGFVSDADALESQPRFAGQLIDALGVEAIDDVALLVRAEQPGPAQVVTQRLRVGARGRRRVRSWPLPRCNPGCGREDREHDHDEGIAHVVLKAWPAAATCSRLYAMLGATRRGAPLAAHTLDYGSRTRLPANMDPRDIAQLIEQNLPGRRPACKRMARATTRP